MAITGNPEKHGQIDVFCKKFNIDSQKSPSHIAIIMDGNGRWATAKNKLRIEGHKKGVSTLKQCIKNCILANVHYLSVYAFSTENWTRPKKEVNFLLALFKNLLQNEIQDLHAENIRLKCLGDLVELPKNIQTLIIDAEALTDKNTGFQVNLMVNYGSKRELKQASIRMAEDINNGSLVDITDDTLSQYLYTSDIPDPDILIRPGGEVRLSNFMLFQLAYSEYFFIETLWPDFNDESLANIIVQFQKRGRRFGGLNT
jgi:undecaprenyl diphosphate synthase